MLAAERKILTMCAFDQQKGPRRLMRKGIALIIVGHINFILGAIVHGTVLRHISKPSGRITTEYSAANIIAVSSGLLSIATGIIAILVSRNLLNRKLQVGLLVGSFLNTLLSAACTVGILLAISLTIHGGGHSLMQGCNFTSAPAGARSSIVADCPFDTTRIYDTTLTLWFPCAFLAATEAGISIWCFIIGLTLRGLWPCGHSYITRWKRPWLSGKGKIQNVPLRRYCLLGTNLPAHKDLGL
ncbi:keratinocyte-associated protein 3 isoform X1 [Paramormyrops kingsleyae]|uniref:keratinocyte-associated protein 3 isoform X1 n=1 Tax=Paramormyrops kingsleyae TaxID=1676925 RepID=UPI003B975566